MSEPLKIDTSCHTFICTSSLAKLDCFDDVSKALPQLYGGLKYFIGSAAPVSKAAGAGIDYNGRVRLKPSLSSDHGPLTQVRVDNVSSVGVYRSSFKCYVESS